MLIDRVHQRIALIDERDALLREKRDLEGENDEQPVHPGLELAVAARAGRPGLGGNIPEDADAAGVAPFRDPHVEARIVDQDDDVGIPGQNVPLAFAQAPQQFAGLGDHVRAHHGALAVVGRQLRARRLHHLPAPAAQHRLRVFGAKALDKIAPVQVAGSLAGDQIVAHRRSISATSVLSMFCGVITTQPCSMSRWSASAGLSPLSVKSPAITYSSSSGSTCAT